MCCWPTLIYIKNSIFLLFQLVDVSESHPANGDERNDAANVKLVFNQNWRPGVTVSSLLIQRVNKSHNGVFQCIPSNSEAKQIKVHVLKGKRLTTQCLKITEKVSFNIASEASYVNNLS